MRVTHIRLSTRRLMVVIGLIGVGLAVSRMHPFLGSFSLSVLVLAFLRTCEKIDGVAPMRLEVKPRDRVVRSVEEPLASEWLETCLEDSRAGSQSRAFGSGDDSPGTPKRPGDIVRVFLASVLVAGAMLGLALLPGIFLVPAAMTPRVSHAPPRFDAFTAIGVVVSALLSIPITSSMRRKLW